METKIYSFKFYSDFECTILGNITSNLPKEVLKKKKKKKKRKKKEKKKKPTTATKMGQVKLEFNPKTENIQEQDPNPKVHLTRQIPSVGRVFGLGRLSLKYKRNGIGDHFLIGLG